MVRPGGGEEHLERPFSPVLSLSDAVMHYRGGAMVGPVSLDLAPGQVVGLVGGNGAGKTTILRMVCGLVAPHSGTVVVAGEPVTPGVTPSCVGGLIEEPPVYGWATGRQHLQLAASADPHSIPRIQTLLELVGLTKRADTRVSTYSQGMRQRLGIARAMLRDPDLLVLDEPSNGLDPHGVNWLRGMLRDRASAGKAVIVSSHLLAEMQLVADQVVLLAGGGVIGYVDVAALPARAGALEQRYFEILAATETPEFAP